MDLTFCEYLVFHEFRVCVITLAKYVEQESIAGLFSSSSFQVLRKSHESRRLLCNFKQVFQLI